MPAIDAPDQSEFEYFDRLEKAGFRWSRDRENLIEHVFISEVLQEAWFVREQRVEILRSEVDAYGYDLVIECNGIIRHVQLKSSGSIGRARSVTVNRSLESKSGGCVVWVVFDHDPDLGRVKLRFLYFGGRRPRDRMPSLGDVVGTNPLSKKDRPNTRKLKKSQFDEIPTVAELLDRMFGKVRKPA